MGFTTAAADKPVPIDKEERPTYHYPIEWKRFH
jgi:hypothetical protein